MRVLVDGASGSGKSTIGRLLCADERGHFIEADVDTYCGRSLAFFRSRRTGEGADCVDLPISQEWLDEYDWVWRIDLLAQMLDSCPRGLTVVVGGAGNQNDALPLFDKVFVLYADEDSLRERITHREGNDFGKDQAEFAWIVKDSRDSLRRAEKAGAFLIDTTDLTCEQVVNICRREIKG